jgi:catechol 2,3-dioxygenase-like lactoylglutathione lyase family enzyme
VTGVTDVTNVTNVTELSSDSCEARPARSGPCPGRLGLPDSSSGHDALGAYGVVVTFVCHGEAAVPGPFDERRSGLDHVSFAVAARPALDAWVARLDEHGVVHSGIVSGATGDLVPFRDPDNIALEFYTRPA